MWKKKLLAPLSSSLVRRGSQSPSPNILKHDSIFFSQFSTHDSIFVQSLQRKYILPFPFYFSFRVFQNPSLHSARTVSLFSSGSDSSHKLRCWNCNATASNTTTPFLFCDVCRSIQPVDHSIDYFQIFGLEKKFEIEEGDLEGKYKDWQKKLHPDLVHSKSQDEREYAAEQSARVITAYRTLIDPLSRAMYIMKLEGVEVDEEERISDLELLSEMMEIREAVEEAGDTQTLNQIKNEMQEKMGLWSKSFADAFRSRNYDEALASIQRMTYYKRAIEEIVKKL